MGLHHFTGSKRKSRIADRERRLTAAFKKRLARIYELSRCIKDEQELEFILSQIPDEDVRAETRKLIEPFLMFQVGQRADAGAEPTSEAVDGVIQLATENLTKPPARTIVLTDLSAETFH